MIQRVQSVFLFLVLIALGTQFILDYAVSAKPMEFDAVDGREDVKHNGFGFVEISRIFAM